MERGCERTVYPKMEGFIANRAYQPGNLIHTEEAFARVLRKSAREKFCERCVESSTHLLSCKTCLTIKYCSKACQEKDWPDHRLECKHIKNLPECLDPDFVRLFGKIILKTKGTDWKTITRNILGNDVSFDDIDPCYKRMTENSQAILQLKETKYLLTSYIGQENMPDDDDFKKIFGKANFKIFEGSHSKSEVSTLCFFMGISFFNEECIPNSSFAVAHHDTLKIWANRKIEKGSEKISLSFNKVLDFSKSEDICNCPDQYICKCTDCSLPYGESVLTKIIDENRAFSVIKATKGTLMAARFVPENAMPNLNHLVGGLLKKHEGVLGDTNRLHLKTLALKCMKIRANPLEVRATLMKLENIIRPVFGEYYSELKNIYSELMMVNLFLGNMTEFQLYIIKLHELDVYGS